MKKIVDTGKKARRIDPLWVAEQLGAEIVENQIDLDPEIAAIVNRRFMDLISYEKSDDFENAPASNENSVPSSEDR